MMLKVLCDIYYSIIRLQTTLRNEHAIKNATTELLIAEIIVYYLIE